MTSFVSVGNADVGYIRSRLTVSWPTVSAPEQSPVQLSQAGLPGTTHATHGQPG
jgi:hypothetical protein